MRNPNGETSNDSFESLFTRLQPRLYAYCRKYIDDEEQARDLVQECFMNYWIKMNQLDGTPDSYLFRSVHNRCLSYFRAMKIRNGYKQSVKAQINEIVLTSSDPYPLAELYLKEADQMLSACIETLPEKCREIFLMSRYRDMSTKEISEKMGISVRTVESHIYHALRTLKRQLKDYLPILTAVYPWLF